MLSRLILFSLAALVAWETYLRVMKPPRENRVVVVSIQGAKEHTIKDPHLGYRPSPNTKATIRTESFDGEKLTEATYTSDGFQRRATFPNAHRKTNNAVAFFGCSYTFGSGVNDAQTLPSQFSQLHPNVRVYNYGYIGYGPQQTLSFLEHKTPSKIEIPENDVDIVYTFIDDHVRRAIGSLGSVASRRGGFAFPYYTQSFDGSLEFHADMLSKDYFRGWVFPVILWSRALSELVGDLPEDLQREHFELTARILNGAADRFHKKHPTGNFYVLFYPGTTRVKEISQTLEKGSIRILDYSGEAEFVKPEYRIPIDNHPTPLAYRSLASRITRDLH